MENIQIRSAEARDAAGIAALHVESWRDAYASILDAKYLGGPVESEKLQHWAQMIESPSIIEVAEDECGRLVGFVCALPDADPERGSRVDNLHVLPTLRGRGIGEQLLRHAASVLQNAASHRDMHLWVFEVNERAIHFYLDLGGKVIGRDFSRIPAARRKPIICIGWGDLTCLSETS